MKDTIIYQRDEDGQKLLLFHPQTETRIDVYKWQPCGGWHWYNQISKEVMQKMVRSAIAVYTMKNKKRKRNETDKQA